MQMPACDLCGAVSLDVRPAVAEYPDGYKALMRCSDHEACRERVFLAGEEWPLLVPEEVPG